MNEKMIIREYGDPSRLVESIRDEAARKIESIKEQTRQETAKAEKEYEDEMLAFREARQRETDEAINNAEFIMRNRAAIEKRKIHLNATEQFIRRMVHKTVSDYIAGNSREYLSFLKRILADVLSGSEENDIVVHLCPGDAAMENELRDSILQDTTHKGAVNFIIDTAMTTGGAILESREKGVSYNFSMERIISRNYDSIRKEAMKIIQKYSIPKG